MESTIPWVVWMIIAMFVALALVVVFPSIALWLPQVAGVLMATTHATLDHTGP